MEQKNVNILSAKFGLKKISIKYYDNTVGQNRSAEEVDYPTPDLINARDDLREDLAQAYFFTDTDDVEKFKVTGFEISEKDSIRTVVINGNMTSYHEYLEKVSATILLDDEQKDLKLKLDTVIMELFEFIFNAKTASGKLEDFPANAHQEQEQKEFDSGKDSGETKSKSKDLNDFDGEIPVVKGSPADKDRKKEGAEA